MDKFLRVVRISPSVTKLWCWIMVRKMFLHNTSCHTFSYSIWTPGSWPKMCYDSSKWPLTTKTESVIPKSRFEEIPSRPETSCSQEKDSFPHNLFLLPLRPFLPSSSHLCGVPLTVFFIPDKVWDTEGGSELQFHIRMPLWEQQKLDKVRKNKTKGKMVSIRCLTTKHSKQCDLINKNKGESTM